VCEEQRARARYGVRATLRKPAPCRRDSPSTRIRPTRRSGQELRDAGRTLGPHRRNAAELRIPYSMMRRRITKPGYEEFEGAPLRGRSLGALAQGIALDPLGTRPAGTVRIPAACPAYRRSCAACTRTNGRRSRRGAVTKSSHPAIDNFSSARPPDSGTTS